MKTIRSKRCVICNESFKPQYTTTQRTCSVGCAITFSKLKEAQKQAGLDSVRNEKDWQSLLQTHINKIVRLIDKGQPCLAKGIHSKQVHAGHVYSRGSNATIRYNLHNIHRQSAQSNHFQNEDGIFREGIVKEYGERYMEFIGGLRSLTALNYSDVEYKQFSKKASKIALRLSKDERIYNKEERIQMRNLVNAELNIYKNHIYQL